MRWLGWMVAAGLMAACTGNLGGDDEDATGATTSTTATTSMNGSGGSGANTTSSGAAGPGSGGSGNSTTVGSGGSGGDPEVAMVCNRWNADRAELSEGSWSGNLAMCNAGDISAAGRANALTQVNLHRWLADLPPVVTDATRDQKAQACALMMDANNMLSHTPPASWTCYTAAGAEAAGKSNIASGPGVMAVDMYMSDFGNGTTMGHRRWILSNSLGPIGLGSTSNDSCMWVISGSGNANRPWTAWPAEGVFPVEAMTQSFQSIDDTGWTIQSNSINLGGAQVTVTDNGNPAPVQVSSLAGGYGSTYAIKMIPQGWTSQAGHTYAVSVAGVSEPIDYEVQMVACE
jgi:uncharacterized protein YkwD